MLIKRKASGINFRNNKMVNVTICTRAVLFFETSATCISVLLLYWVVFLQCAYTFTNLISCNYCTYWHFLSRRLLKMFWRLRGSADTGALIHYMTREKSNQRGYMDTFAHTFHLTLNKSFNTQMGKRVQLELNHHFFVSLESIKWIIIYPLAILYPWNDSLLTTNTLFPWSFHMEWHFPCGPFNLNLL